MKQFLNAATSSGGVMWITIIEVLIFSGFLIWTPTTNTKYYLIGWTIWLIILTITKHYKQNKQINHDKNHFI